MHPLRFVFTYYVKDLQLLIEIEVTSSSVRRAGVAARRHRDGRRVPAAAGPAAARGRARAPRRQLRHAAHHLPAHRQRRAGLR